MDPRASGTRFPLQVNKPRNGSSWGGGKKNLGAELFRECIRRSATGTFGEIAMKFMNRAVTPGAPAAAWRDSERTSLELDARETARSLRGARGFAMTWSA